MKRALDIRKREDASAAHVVDRVTLASEDRHRRRLVMTGEAGTRFLLDLPQAAMLRDGDGLVLDDGSIVRVIGKPEPLVEIANPWKNPAARFAVPIPIISWSGSTSSPRRAAKLEAVAIVSVSDTSVIPAAASARAHEPNRRRARA